MPEGDLVHEALEFALPAHSPEVPLSCAKGCACVHRGIQAVHLRKVASLWPCSAVPPLFEGGEEPFAASALSALQASASSVSLQWKALYPSKFMLLARCGQAVPLAKMEAPLHH